MPDLELPEQHLNGIRLLGSMQDSIFEQLLKQTEQATLFIDHKKLATDVAARMPAEVREDAIQIAETAVAMRSFCTYAEVPVNTFIDDVFSSSDVQNLELGDNTAKAKTRITRMLTTQNVIVAAKATAVLTAHEHPFRSARVFTDIRTVFVDDQEDGSSPSPAAAVIVQMMRIRYIKNGNQEEIFFAMDTADVESMIETLLRAKGKCEKLKMFMAKSSLPCVEVSSRDKENA